ncbi:MAG: fructoselysine 6-phosphate deglycase [Anaerolineaceae bacterium]|nr:fructoselysine 6-phosphate deglycase [Anaerolineaceae bacterium]
MTALPAKELIKKVKNIMLKIDKSKVNFLVTAGMVQEVKNIIARDLPKIKRIVDEVIQRGVEKVYFVACGSPLSAAETAKQLFDRYSSIPCTAYSGWDFCDNTPKKLDEKCLVIAISHYGKTEEVIQALELAKKKGAFTVGVTNEAENPLAAVGDYVIDYHAECIWEAHLLISYAFALNIIACLEPNPEIDIIYAQLARLPAILEKLINEYEGIGQKLGERAAKWPFIYTVAGGILQPLAYKEGIVTLLEFTWTHGSALNSAEFRHGPLEVVEQGVPFIFLLGTDKSRHTTERALNFVKRYDSDVITFDYAELGEGLHPMLAPMVLFVPLEWFCYYLAIYKDHNPDDRRYYGGIVEY